MPSTSAPAVSAVPALKSLPNPAPPPVQAIPQAALTLSRPLSVQFTEDSKGVTPKASPVGLLGTNFFKKLSGRFAKQSSEMNPTATPTSSSSELSVGPSVEPTQSMYLTQPCVEDIKTQVQSGFFSPSSSYLHTFSEEHYSYPCDDSAPSSPVSTTPLTSSCYEGEDEVKQVHSVLVSALSAREGMDRSS